MDNGVEKMNKEILRKANLLAEKIKQTHIAYREIKDQLNNCREYLENWTFREDGKTRMKSFEGQIAWIEMPNQGNGKNIFNLRGDDPDAFDFYMKMIPDMIEVFEKKLKRKQNEIQELEKKFGEL